MSQLATPGYLPRSLDDLEGSTISTSLQGLASDCICIFFSQLAAGRTITTRFNVLEEQAFMLTGYTNRLSARPGETISFMVSTSFRSFSVEIVRLLHGDSDLRGPGRKEIALEGTKRIVPGRLQPLNAGSYLTVENHPNLNFESDFTIFTWLWPTSVGTGAQTLLAKQSSTGMGYALSLNADGQLSFRCGNETITGVDRLNDRRWYWVAATYNQASGTATLEAGYHPRDISLPCNFGITGIVRSPGITQEALAIGGRVQGCTVQDGLNGKLAHVSLYSRCLSHSELLDHVQGKVAANPVVALDFAVEPWNTRVHDVSGNSHHAECHQSPVRAMTGPHWKGNCAGDNSAIHFHEDSLTDARWEESFSFIVPNSLQSGVYAARLIAEHESEYLPFIVSPAYRKPTSTLALLLPTFTYVAYGNELLSECSLNCVYDHYVDGAGVPFASFLHPMKTFRPDRGLLKSTSGDVFGRHLCADLYLIDWLCEMGWSVDIITDHQLHRDGVDLLMDYRAVATGSHPEYVSEEILNALETYIGRGGSLAYFGGNGFYSVTTLSPDGTMIEVRRPSGSRPWSSEPGEGHHAMSGEQGGLWRLRGRAPQRLVGAGFTAQGWTYANECGSPRPYEQVADRTHPLVAELLAGIAPQDMIGDFSTLGLGVGAAGDEIDRVDMSLGSPQQTLVLATASGFNADYQLVIDERREINEASTRPGDPLVRADICCFSTPSGGLVFSASSMQWFSALYHNGYNNNVSLMTRNVLNKMING